MHKAHSCLQFSLSHYFIDWNESILADIFINAYVLSSIFIYKSVCQFTNAIIIQSEKTKVI